MAIMLPRAHLVVIINVYPAELADTVLLVGAAFGVLNLEGCRSGDTRGTGTEGSAWGKVSSPRVRRRGRTKKSLGVRWCRQQTFFLSSMSSSGAVQVSRRPLSSASAD
jgi:hypothetical protein